VHPKNIRERALVMKDILQKVIPGCDVRFQGTSTTFKSKTFVDNEVARGEDENRANLDKKNKEETQYIRARKELNTMMSALDREQSSVTAKVAYATKKSEEAYAAMNDMQQFLNILSANYNWEDLLKDPKHSELLASMKNIQNGVFFET
jgi:septal ring factor EnvC (AmiA/AmiB activator)